MQPSSSPAKSVSLSQRWTYFVSGFGAVRLNLSSFVTVASLGAVASWRIQGLAIGVSRLGSLLSAMRSLCFVPQNGVIQACIDERNSECCTCVLYDRASATCGSVGETYVS